MNAALLRRLLAAIVGYVAIQSCGGGSTPPVKGGIFVVTLSGAQANDGAVLFSIGPGVRNVSVGGAAGLRVHVVSRGNGFHVAALGPLQGSMLVTIAVPDAKAPPALGVIQVAASDGTLRTDLTPYALSAALQP